MKRKDLYNYIKEEIVNELTNENVAIELTGTTGKTIQSFPNLSSANKFKSENPNIKAIKQLEEDNLEEMSKIADIIKIQDPKKFALAKEIYTAGKTGALLLAVEKAGAEGITKTSLETALNFNLSTIINSLRAAGVLTPKRDKIIKPEKPEKEKISPTLTPEEEPEEEPTDTYYKGDEEETPEAEPEVANDKDIKKKLGKTLASKLSPEDEEKYNRLKLGIENKVARLKKMSNKERKTSADLENLKALINKTDIINLFKSQGKDIKKYLIDL
jgi:hypothetical protein